MDTNAIIRFITGEPEAQAILSAEFLRYCEDNSSEVVIPTLVVAEVIYVLTGKIYAFPRKKVVEALRGFLNNPIFKVEKPEGIDMALELFVQYKIDFTDAFLASEALICDHSLASFDKDFKKIPGLKDKMSSKLIAA